MHYVLQLLYVLQDYEIDDLHLQGFQHLNANIIDLSFSPMVVDDYVLSRLKMVLFDQVEWIVGFATQLD